MSSNVGNFDEKIPKQRGRCTNCLCMSWKVFTCILSHVTLITCVVAYCVMGSYAFEWLEGQNERDVRSKKKLNILRKEKLCNSPSLCNFHYDRMLFEFCILILFHISFCFDRQKVRSNI